MFRWGAAANRGASDHPGGYVEHNRLKIFEDKRFEYDAFGRRVRKLNGSYASTDFLWDGMRLVQETCHDRQDEEALTYLYESNSYVPLARIDQRKAAANDADVRDGTLNEAKSERAAKRTGPGCNG